MIIKYAPVLYCRTNLEDFENSRLIAQPSFFTSSDAQLVLNSVLASTYHLDDYSSHGRRMVIGNGHVAVSGITIAFEQLFLRAGIPPKYYRLDGKAETGRPNYGFIGVAMLVGNGGTAWLPSDNLLAELYESCIEKRWNERKGPDFYKPLLCDEREIDISEGILPQSHLIKKSNSSSSMVCYYTADLSERQAIAEEEILSVKIFDEALSGKGISYCADVDGIDNSSSFSFDIVTSSRDISSFSLTSNPQNENDTVPSSDGYIKKSERCSERQTLTNDDYIEQKRNQAETPASKDQGNFSPSRYQENGQKRNQKLDRFDRKDTGRGQLSADEFLEHYQQRKREQSKSPEQVNKERLVAVAGAVASTSVLVGGILAEANPVVPIVGGVGLVISGGAILKNHNDKE